MHLIENIADLLKESSEVTHDQFKGALASLATMGHLDLDVMVETGELALSNIPNFD